MMIEEDILPRELTNNIPRRGKWTAEEERYTEKIICKKYLAASFQTCHLYRADTYINPLLFFDQVILSTVLWTFLVSASL